MIFFEGQKNQEFSRQTGAPIPSKLVQICPPPAAGPQRRSRASCQQCRRHASYTPTQSDRGWISEYALSVAVLVLCDLRALRG